jgi:hypothetical protein
MLVASGIASGMSLVSIHVQQLATKLQEVDVELDPEHD